MRKGCSFFTAGVVAAVMMLANVCALDTAHAQQGNSGLQSYDVELIIFRHLGAKATDEEWGLESAGDEEVEIPNEDATPFAAPQPAPAAATENFPALPAAKLKLGSIYDTLRRSRNYQPLAHIGWTQPGFARDSAPFLPIDAFIPASTGASTGLAGKIALSRGRYLHLTLDLTYAQPATATEPAQTYVLRQSRRMRSNERHYIDHPKFGVIAVVTPTAQ